ncbi:MAG: hypothetical protein SFU99_15195 [Saprospiraceae bacterium]|nr:hypothetical protein [Saprospiraceae bacterium]
MKMLSFSQRIGKKPAFKELQIESMDDDLRNSLWNVLKITVLDRIKKESVSSHEELCRLLWIHYFKLPVDEMSTHPVTRNLFIRSYFFGKAWFELYDLLEKVSRISSKISFSEDFINSCNMVLEREFSAYRFINGVIAPVSNTIEVEEVNEAIYNTQRFTALDGANTHLTSSLEKISDKKNPDYRNSIKEAISAVETCCRVITGENTLGKSFNKLEKFGIQINKQLKEGFEHTYHYTNSKESGIRHALIEEGTRPDFEEAKYMLVSCSAFINYLIAKAQKAGIQIQ